MPKLILIHTVASLIEAFNRLAKQMLPGVQVYHILDEVLLDQVRDSSAYMPLTQVRPDEQKWSQGPLARLGDHLTYAENAGADAILVTCSTLSPKVRQLKSELRWSHRHIPIVRIDEAMIEKAVASGRRIGVLATNPTTLEPTRETLLEESALQKRPIYIQTTLVEGALQALLEGDVQSHDRLVRDAMRRISAEVDLVVLAQASMARALEHLTGLKRSQSAGLPDVPVLTSPHTALERVKEYLEGRR